MKYASTYEFDVCIDGREVKEYHHSSDPNTRDMNVYIEGRRGSEFTLKFRNRSNERVLVVLSVDGLSVMDGKPAGKTAGGYVCGPYDTVNVPGWRLNDTKIAKFQFQPQGDRNNKTYVEELASEGFDVDPDNQGVIGVMVFREVKPYVAPATNIHHYHHYNDPWHWSNQGVLYDGYSMTRGVGQSSIQCSDKGGLVPASSKMSFASVNAMPQNVQTSNFVGMNQVTTNTEVSLGTAFGEETKFATTETEFKRHPTAIWTGSIFYDTRTNLQKRGIVFDSFTVKTPNAFPASDTGCYVPKSRR